jgi:4-aminobutyrate aminotransferase-like enzyme
MADSRKSLKDAPQMGAAHTDASEYSEGTPNLALVHRRQDHLGASLLFYHNPVHIVRGEGPYLFDADGQRYLDCYNNVASVGHCHPHVVSALTEQAKLLNTHTRYLHENVIEYAEMLANRMPGDLDICMFVCTGTEANELAMRIARAVTGNHGAVVMKGGYHGNSTLIHELSTAAWPADGLPQHVVAVEPPNTYRGPYRGVDAGLRYADLVDKAMAELDARGEKTAAFLCDTIFDTQGTLEAPKDYFQEVYARVRAAGGLCIADEVQAGLARTGRMWGFEHFDVIPDIVTLGKPMGDGHPVAAVITTPEIARAFTQNNLYFNTFGGNPVSAAVGKAVLEVVDNEKLVEHVADVGAYLKRKLLALAEHHPIIGDVRGLGLFVGIELVEDRETKTPAVEIARQLPDQLKEEGILIGITGRLGNVLKVRPPLVFSHAQADQLVEALNRVLP